MAFGIAARCPRTGQIGIALSSERVAVGRYCESVLPRAGCVLLLGQLDLGINRLGMALLADGASAAEVAQELRHGDPLHAQRSIGVVDRNGMVSASTGAAARPLAAHRLGDGYVVVGEDLANPDVLDAMAAAFDAKASDAGLDGRLMAALLAGHGAGGSRSAERSAAVITYGDGRAVELFLRVDLAPDATPALQQVFDEYKLYEPLYKTRVDAPDQALTPDEVEAAVARKRSLSA